MQLKRLKDHQANQLSVSKGMNQSVIHSFSFQLSFFLLSTTVLYILRSWNLRIPLQDLNRAQLAPTTNEKGEPEAGLEIKANNCPPSLIHICRFPVVATWISAPLPCSLEK